MLQTTVNGKYRFPIRQEGSQWLLGDEPADMNVAEGVGGLVSVLYEGRSYEAIIEGIDKSKKEVTLRLNGQRYVVSIEEPIDQLLHEMGLDLSAAKKIEPIKAPMPGMVLKILVSPGQRLAKGDGILILEAMKMENVLKAPADATVKAIRVQERTAVGKGDVLIDLE